MDLSPSRVRADVEHLVHFGLRATVAAVAALVDTVVDAVDIDAVLGAVDIDALVQRVDLGALIARVDVNEVIQRVDVDALIQRIDVDGLIARIDIDALVEDTDLGAVVARSTGTVASGAVDLVRRQTVGLDDAMSRLARRLRPRRLSEVADAPPRFAGEGAL